MKRTDYLRALKYCEDELLEDLIVTDVIYDLKTCTLFTEEDEQNVLYEKTRRAQVSKLLSIIRAKDDVCFEKFRDILRTTNEDIAESLESELSSGGQSRNRRISRTELGEILIKGSVPERAVDYIKRADIEKNILNLIKDNPKKPILVHGVVGCGKTSIVSNLIYTDDLFPNRFMNCCWISVGHINESDVFKQLAILLRKLSFGQNIDIPNSNIPEILVESIKERLYDTTTLLIVDDVRNATIMKYFTYPNTYIVIARSADLFADGAAQIVKIDDNFTIDQCKEFLEFHDIKQPLFGKIIEKSRRNPKALAMITNMILSNSDYANMIDDINVIDDILKEYINILHPDIRKYYEMLDILKMNDIVTCELLSIYWNLNPNDTLMVIEKLCKNNFLNKKWIPEYECNMYSINDLQLDYFQSKLNKEHLEVHQNLLFDRFRKRYPDWLAIDLGDPFFLMLYGKILHFRQDLLSLNKLYNDYSFIAAKIVICGIADLINDYERYCPAYDNKNWKEFKYFLMKYSHKFNILPANKYIVLKIGKIFTMLIQLGLYEMKDLCTYKLAREAKELSKRNDFWDWINPKLSIKIWEIGYDEDIAHVDVNQLAILIGNESGRIRLLEFNSGKCLFDYKISNKIILVKFITNLEFIIVDSSCQFWLFNPSDLLSQVASSPSDGDDDFDDDTDFRPPVNLNKRGSFDYFGLREQFQKLLIEDFKEKCTYKKINSEKLIPQENESIQALNFSDKIIFIHSGESSTYVAYYGFDGQMEDNFKVDFHIKKLKLHSSELRFYALKEESGQIILIDEFGNAGIPISIDHEVILDFTVEGDDIYCSVKNRIYKYPQLLFSISDTDAHIAKISVSMENKLIALYLTNDNIQIWDLNAKEFMYSLNDSQFTDVFFLSDTNYLITTGQTNVAKWQISALDSINTDNNAYCQSLTYFRGNFAMHNITSSSFCLVLQSFKNGLELLSFGENENNKHLQVDEDLEASCFFCNDNHVFIGFKNATIKIYELGKFQKVQEFKSHGEVEDLCTFHISDNAIGLAVRLLGNKITIFHLNKKDFTPSKQSEPDLPTHISIIKFFKFNSHLIVTIFCDVMCSLYKVNEEGWLKYCQYNLQQNYVDVDISSDNKYLCLIATTGEIQVQEIGGNGLWEKNIENCSVLRKCKFRPMLCKWNVVAVIDDKARIYLIYFSNSERELKINIIIEDSPTQAKQYPKSLMWTNDSNYLLVGDYDIRKWKIPMEPRKKNEVKLPLTKLQTFFGGIECIRLNDEYICTVDRQGYLYVLKKID